MASISESDRFKIDTVKTYLRRKYPVTGANSLDTLKGFADSAYAQATDTVTLTSTSADGTNVSGQITFEKIFFLAGIEELIAEYDPQSVIPEQRVVVPDFSNCRAV